MEFLLSLSPKGKEKISSIKAPNKSVSYSDQQLSEEDTNWVLDMKRKIADYLKLGPEGPYFYRMVETVLSRDKNWVHWKVENCPPIEMAPVSPQVFLDAKIAAGKLATAKKMRDAPMGSMNWDFLQDEDPDEAWKKLENPERYQQPDLKTLQRKLEDAKFDIEMARDPKEKQRAVEAKNSLTWVALRVASRSKLAMFDKIETDDDIDVIFRDKPKEPEPQEAEDTSAAAHAVFPDDRKPIVIVDASRTSKLSIAKRLASQHPGVFTRVPAHITRKPLEGEKDGHDYHFVDTQTFNMMRDGDQLIEFTEGDYSQGTSRKHVQAVGEAGKVAIMEMNHDVSVMLIIPLTVSQSYAFQSLTYFATTERTTSQRLGLLSTLHLHRATLARSPRSATTGNWQRSRRKRGANTSHPQRSRRTIQATKVSRLLRVGY